MSPDPNEWLDADAADSLIDFALYAVTLILCAVGAAVLMWGAA